MSAVFPPLAVIDLGTNTFHLLIATVSEEGTIVERYRERVFVKLASEGIETIGAAPFARGIEALKSFRKILEEYRVDKVVAIGTAALRTASNGAAFVRTAELEAGTTIELISGDREAALITRGVLAALPPLTDRVLIMDVGGGSTEYIIASAEGVHWRQSFPIGVAVLQRTFHHADPIDGEEVHRLEAFLQTQLRPLQEALGVYPTQHLVGSAGTFDVMADMLRDAGVPAGDHSHDLDLTGLAALQQRIIAATAEERLAMSGLPEQRVDLIVVAMLLIRYTVVLAGIDRITVSEYAMKEGILLEASASGRNPESPRASA